MTPRSASAAILASMLISCGPAAGGSGAASRPGGPGQPPPASTFGEDLAFLQAHTPVILLTSADARAQVAVAPAYQGRVMTSTARGLDGASYGYVHRPGVSAGVRQPHMTVLGGEDRFWLGPEGGQYGLYFAPGAPFDFEHWQVPEALDWGGWKVTAQSEREVSFEQEMQLENHAGSAFSLRVERTVRLLDAEAITRALGRAIGPGTHVVAYESDNRITNTGSAGWSRETGLLSIWILGMFKPSPTTTVVIPYVVAPESERGKIVNDAYFGKVPADRLKVDEGVLYFRADGAERGKIGLSCARVRDVAGSYDPASHTLTLVQYSLPIVVSEYVNSLWEHQDKPYAGDAVNSYNDGPPAPGQPPLGPFYELESSSPALMLEPNKALGHVHRTIHLEGPEAELDPIARALLGVSLAQIADAL